MIGGLIRLLYPPKCPFCEKLLQKGESLICGECRNSLPYAGAEGKRSGRFFTLCVSPLLYRDKAREAMLRYKFGSRSGSAAAFGSLVAERVDRELAGKYDRITWVPVSFLRLRRRGYSQSCLLAKETARILGAETDGLLRKRGIRPPQSRLNGAAARTANVSGAFAAIHPERFRGKRILLIDDVVTTGATLSECARVLLTEGAADVVCATLCCRPHRP